jgi:hypothetical protein
VSAEPHPEGSWFVAPTPAPGPEPAPLSDDQWVDVMTAADLEGEDPAGNVVDLFPGRPASGAGVVADVPMDAAQVAEFHALTDPRDPPDPADVAWEQERLARLAGLAAERQRDLAASLERAGYTTAADFLEAVGLPAPLPEPGRPSLAPVAALRPSPTAGRWLVNDFVRPATLIVLASLEGLGKSGLRTELAVRGATGAGPFVGYFEIPERFRVATFDEENGPDEELRRDLEALDSLGLAQDALGDRYQRVSFAGLNLNAPGDRAYLDAEIGRTRPDLLILDTAGSMVADEWGAPLKETIRYLRSLARRFGVAVLLVVHMTKPARNGKPGAGEPVHGSRLTDVMGQWTRSVDVAAIMADLGAGRVRLEIMKRVPHAVLILQRDAGLWRLLTIGESGPARDRTDLRVLRAIEAGAEASDQVRAALGEGGRLMPERTFYDALKRLRKDGLIGDGTPLRLTADGTEAIG